MKVSAIHNIAKKSLIPIMLAGAAHAFASAPIKNNSPATIKDSPELVSKTGAEAIKAANLYSVQQTTVPTVHNSRIDNDLRKYAENAEEKKQLNDILNSAYQRHGTYLASAFIQHEIDVQQLYIFMTANTDILAKNNIDPALSKKIKAFGPKFFKTVTPKKEYITDWAFNDYNPALTNWLKFDHKPNYEEVDIALSNVVDNKLGLDIEEIVKFYKKEGDFRKNKLNNRKDNIAKSESLAYKMYLIDCILFEKAMKSGSIFGKDSFEQGKYTLLDYYREWMESVNPKTK